MFMCFFRSWNLPRSSHDIFCPVPFPTSPSDFSWMAALLKIMKPKNKKTVAHLNDHDHGKFHRSSGEAVSVDVVCCLDWFGSICYLRRTQRGRTLQRGILGTFWKPYSQNTFWEPSQSPFYFQTHGRPTPQNPARLRTFPQNPSPEPFLERCVAVRPLSRAPNYFSKCY